MVISVAGNVSPKRVWDKMTNFLAGVDNTILEDRNLQPTVPAACGWSIRIQNRYKSPGCSGHFFRDESRHVQNVMNSIFGEH